MSALADSSSALDRRVAWLWHLLREELAPYPGRIALVSRIVLASVIVMILVMTFHVPGAALAGYYTLLLSRETPSATFAGAIELIASFGAGVGYVLVSSLLFFGSPMLHFLWVIGSFFVIFYAIRVLRSYSAGAGFGFLIATCIPVWDRAIPSELAVEATLWTAGSVALGAVVTVAVEYVFAPFRRSSPLDEGLLDRWSAIEQTLIALAQHQEPTAPAAKVDQFATVGVSRLRRILVRSGSGVEHAEKLGAMIAVTEHLVNLTASLLHVRPQGAYAEESRLSSAAAQLAQIRLRHADPALNTHHVAETLSAEPPSTTVPLLPEIERNIAMLKEALEEGPATTVAAPRPRDDTPRSIFIADAWTNPAHMVFALKGCLAASACYVFYNAIAWPGLNTAVATCIVTALSSVGSSRQKQLLRIGGAIAGGVIFGMGAQVFLLPYMDSITAFTVLFAVVTAIAAWFSTSSARLSYFGMQIALAFYLINLQEFAFQTSLTIARDRVFGILLGLFVMWIVFDLLGGTRAADQMLARFRKSIRRMADLQELSLAGDAETITTQAHAIREELIGHFGVVNAEADAVLLETGSHRPQDIALRRRILATQPALRSLLLLQITALQYRRQRLLHELPAEIANAQRSFDEAVAADLRSFAEDRPSAAGVLTQEAFDQLHRAIQEFYGETNGGNLSATARAILSLSESISTVIKDVSKQLDATSKSGELTRSPGLPDGV